MNNNLISFSNIKIFEVDSKKLKKILADNIKKYRKKLQLSQNSLGKLTDIDKNAFYAYEHEKCICSLEKAIKLCTLFNISLGEFLGFTKN